MRIFRLPLVALALVAAAGCSSRPSDDAAASESAHTEGQYVHAANNPFFWTRSVAHAELGYPHEDLSRVLPDGDDLAVRLQAWADRIDDLVRAKVTKQGHRLVAPKPIVKVLPSHKTFNAWVSAVPVCLGVPFSGVASDRSPSHTLLGASWMAGSNLPPGTVCRRPAEWPALDALLRVWPEQGPNCDLSLVDGKLTSPRCSGTTAPDTVLYAVTPFVHFSTPLLASIDERTAVTTLAHELAHYYRAHPSTLVDHKYGFWYEHDPALPGRPLPAARQVQLGAHYRKVFASPKNMTIDGALYHGRLHGFVAQIAELIRTRTEPRFVCASAVSKVGDWVAGFLRPAPDGLTPAMKQAYLAFERELGACAPRLRVDTGISAADTIELARFQMAVSSSGLNLSSSAVPVTSLAGALTALTTLAKGMDTEEREMLAKLREGKIGLYTAEQEADEMALDVSTKLGISSGEVLGGWIKFMKAVEDVGATFAEDETGNLGSVKCRALLDAKFTEAGPGGTRVPAQMTLGSLDDDHHGECYRVYNLWRENNGHRYETRGTFTPPAGPSWDDLVLHAANLSGWGPKDVPPEATTPPEDVPPADVAPESVSGDETSLPRGPRDSGDVAMGCSATPCRPGSPHAAAAALAALVAAASRRRRRR